MENWLINIDTSTLINTWIDNQGWISSAFSWFFAQVKSWDFSLLKWVLIWILILIPIVLIFLLVSWKICLFNTWFWEWYWLRLITWWFGAWKTKNVFQSAFLWKKQNPHWILISNMNYDFVDFYFNSKKDFDFILRDLVQYIHETNSDEELKKSIAFPPVKIIVDEAHLYLFARDFKWFTKDILLVLTQCRKRDISVDFITQELWQIDVFIRRLCPYIEYFEKMPLWMTKQSIVYSLDVEWTSMKDETKFEEIESSILLPFSRWPIFDKSVKHYYDQKFLTKKVIGYENVWYSDEDKDALYSNKYEEFKNKMLKNITNYRNAILPKASLLDRILWKVNKKPNEKLSSQVLKARIYSNSCLLNSFKDFLWDDVVIDLIDHSWIKVDPKIENVDEQIFKYQSMIIVYLCSQVSDEDFAKIIHLSDLKENELVNNTELLQKQEDNIQTSETI